jgi:UDP-N-acetylmuramate--alanine ligase
MYVGQIKEGGRLFQRKGLELENYTKTSAEFSLEGGQYHVNNLRIENAEMVFDIVYPDGEIKDCKLLTPGFHNVENALVTTAHV